MVLAVFFGTILAPAQQRPGLGAVPPGTDPWTWQLWSTYGDSTYGDRASGVAVDAIAMFLVVAQFGTLSFSEVNAQASRIAGTTTATVLGLFLFLAASGKSAQLPLYFWLPDAMAGPTPVSALIHAATMVTAGVYALVRVHPLLEASPMAMGVVAGLGALTALFAATIALAQSDLKAFHEFLRPVVEASTFADPLTQAESQKGFVFTLALGAALLGIGLGIVRYRQGILVMVAMLFYSSP